MDIKVNSMGLCEDVITAIEAIVRNARSVRVLYGKYAHGLHGLSGNHWRPDIVVVKQTNVSIPTSQGMIGGMTQEELFILECKEVDATYQTYRNQMMRAYAELGDLRNFSCPKFVIVPRKHRTTTRAFNYNSFFESIGASLIEWNTSEGKEKLLSRIANVTGAESGRVQESRVPTAT